MQSEEATIAKEIMRGVPWIESVPARERVVRAHIRTLGDRLGEPILSDPKQAPAHYVSVTLPCGPGFEMVVAMSPKAVELLLGL